MPHRHCSRSLARPNPHPAPVPAGVLPPPSGPGKRLYPCRCTWALPNPYLHPPYHAWPQPLSITLKGITNDSTDPGVDTYRTVTLPLLRKALGGCIPPIYHTYKLFC